ncbi:MAG: acyltransferase [Clostridia bacterium]|nr:acyltransferase [Clostridia bacterium]
MQQAANGERIRWVERVQVFSMLLVVLHHCIPHGYDGSAGLLALLEAIQYPALACFFLTSGLFAGKYREAGWPAYMRKRFTRLMTPYFCVNLLMLAPRYVAARLMGFQPKLTPAWLLMSFLNPHGQGIAPHLWFLPTLLLCASLLPVLDALMGRGRAARSALLVALLALSLMPVRLTSLFCLEELRRYLVFYAAGHALARTRGLDCPLRGRAGRAVGAAGLAAFALILILCPASPLAAGWYALGGGAALLALAGLSAGNDPLTRFFRGKTFTIYILSMCAQNLAEAVGYSARLPWFVTAGAMLVLGLAVPCAWHRLDRAHPLPRFLRLMTGL